MAFEFLYTPLDKTDWRTLQQGDILQRNPALTEALRKAHAYYADAGDYTHFMVVTQSCDLVIRGGRKPKSRYITLAAVRPLKVLIDRLITKYQITTKIDFPFPVCQKATQNLVSQLLEHLLHNEERGYFLLRKQSHPNITEDLCAFLTLSVALKADHYAACVSAKIAQLDPVFQAKVGWLTGNLYARVGTPDLEEFEPDPEAYKKNFFHEILYRHTVWLSPGQLSKLKQLVAEWKRDNPGQPVTDDVARTLATRVPDDLDLIAERAIAQLADAKLLAGVDEETKRRAMHLLINDNRLKQLIKLVQVRDLSSPD